MPYKITEVYPPGTAVDIHPYYYMVFPRDNKYHVRDYNGNVKYSDTSATKTIQWALDNLTSGRSHYETVLLKGNFNLDATTINLPSYLNLVIQGIVKQSNNIVGLKAISQSNIKVSGGTLEGAAGADNTLIEFYECSNIFVNNVEFKSQGHIGLRIRGVGSNFIVSNCYFHDCVADGLNISAVDTQRPSYVVVSNNIARNCPALGMAVRANYATVVGNICEGSTLFIGLDIEGSHNTISNNILRNNKYGLKLMASNCIISSNLIKGNTTAGIHWTQYGNNLLCDNIIIDNYNGLVMDSSFTDYRQIKDSRVCRNIIQNNTNYGIYVNDIDNIEFLNNWEQGWELGDYTNVKWKWNKTFISEEYGTATFSGDNTTTTFQIATGLWGKVGHAEVWPMSKDASGDFYYTLFDSKINVTYKTPPPLGTNNVILEYWAEV